MSVLQLMFFRYKGTVPIFTDDVFNTNQSCNRTVAIEDDTLVQIVSQMNTEMCGFDLAAHIIGVKMEAIEICAHRFQRIFWLEQIRADVQHTVFERVSLTDPSDGERFSASDDSTERCRSGRDPQT